MQTRWSSRFSDPQLIEFVFREIKEIISLILYWEVAYGKSYEILLSRNGQNWFRVYSTTRGDGSIDDIYFW